MSEPVTVELRVETVTGFVAQLNLLAELDDQPISARPCPANPDHVVDVEGIHFGSLHLGIGQLLRFTYLSPDAGYDTGT